MIELETTEPTEKKIVLIFPSEDVKRFKEINPAHGALTWFCREALRRYNALHDITESDKVIEAVSDIVVPNSGF